MSVKWAKVGIGFLLLMVVLACVGTHINDAGQDSRKSVVIAIDLSRREEFFDQLRKFAKANGFSILIDTLSSSTEKFQVSMRRDDIIISGASPFEPNQYYIDFFDVTDQPVAPDSVFEYLVSELEKYVSEVPGTTFSIRK
jgi:hypothetical protein